MYISKISPTNKGYSKIEHITKNNSTSIKNNNSNQQNCTGISLPLNYYANLNHYSKPLSFMGKNVYIVDGGPHATNMEHFAQAISKDMDTEIFEVSTIYNNPNMKSLKGLEMQLRNLRKNRNLKNAYQASIDNSETYEAELYCYEHSGFINQLITRPPEKPDNYNQYKENEEEKCYIINAKLDAEKIFKTLARICSIKNEKYPEKVCLSAYYDIKNTTIRGAKVLEARANGIQYIGDLYNEIEPN